MKGEIDKDYYCSADLINEYKRCKSWNGWQNYECVKKDCKSYHRKYPTPEQFAMEYGQEHLDYGNILPSNFPVWFLIENDPDSNFQEWILMTYEDALQYEREAEEADIAPIVYIICACTPWGKPPDDWRPE